MRSTAFDRSNLGDWSMSDQNVVLARTFLKTDKAQWNSNQSDQVTPSLLQPYQDAFPLKCPQALSWQLTIDPLSFDKLCICMPTWYHLTSGVLLVHPQTSHSALLAICGEHMNWKRKHTASSVREKKTCCIWNWLHTQSTRTRFK